MAEEPAGMEFFRVRGPPAITNFKERWSQPSSNNKQLFDGASAGQQKLCLLRSLPPAGGRWGAIPFIPLAARLSFISLIHFFH